MPQSDNRLPYTRRGHKPGRGRRLDAPCALRKTNPVGGHSICPRCKKFNFNTRGGSKPPPYGWQSVNSEQAGGEPPPLQILGFVRRGHLKAPSRREPFCLCEHCGKHFAFILPFPQGGACSRRLRGDNPKSPRRSRADFSFFCINVPRNRQNRRKKERESP